jgi:flagellar protein FlaF
MYANPLQAYENVDKQTMSGREIEASVLKKAARKLRDCQNNWDSSDRDQNLEDALKFNQRIWSIFQSELSRGDNPLPQKLRMDILRLSAFVDRRIFETMAEPSPDKLNIIIDINNNLASGLTDSEK